MITLSRITAVISILVVTACSEPDTYPVTGQACGADDPVKEMSVPHCLPQAL